MKQRDATRRFFARPLDRGAARRHVPRWPWLLAGLWLAWVTVISDHSFWRIARLRHDLRAARTDLQRVQRETASLDARLHDPEERREHECRPDHPPSIGPRLGTP